MEIITWVFQLKLWILLCFFLIIFSLRINHNDLSSLSNGVLINHKNGIYFNEYELLVQKEKEIHFILNLTKYCKKYRIEKSLGRWYLQVNKFPMGKISSAKGQRGFYRFFQMTGKLFLIDALSNIYVVNKEPQLFINQIENNVEDVEVIHIHNKMEINKILVEIHKRAHKIISWARNISEYSRFNRINSKIWVLRDNLISPLKLQEIMRNGSEVGIFLIVWGNEDQFIKYKNLFNKIFIFRGSGLLQNDQITDKECLYIRKSFCKRIIIEENI